MWKINGIPVPLRCFNDRTNGEGIFVRCASLGLRIEYELNGIALNEVEERREQEFAELQIGND